MSEPRVVVTHAWLFDGLDDYQSVVLAWYLPTYIRDDAWQ